MEVAVPASITSWRSVRASRSSANSSRERSLSASVSSSFPRATAVSSDLSMRDRPASAAFSLSSMTTTSQPALAATSAIPDPMSPHPTIPTRSRPGTSARG